MGTYPSPLIILLHYPYPKYHLYINYNSFTKTLNKTIMDPQHIQRTFLINLFTKCRNIDISTHEAAQLVINEINENYQLREEK